MKCNFYKRFIQGLLIVSALTTTLSSCKKDFGNINDPWDNKVYFATIPAMYNNIVASLQENGHQLFSSSLYQATQLAANYAASGFRLDNQVGGVWENYYFTLADFRKVSDMIEADPNVAKMANVKAMLKTLMAYKALKTTTLFGDIPYTEAGKSFYGTENYRPIYDKQADVFTAALTDLKWALDNFTTAADQFSLGASETLFNNNIDSWVKFANSIRLRYALVMREKNAAAADAVIKEALAKPLLSGSEFVGLNPASISGLIIDRAGSFRGNSYVRMGSTMFNSMSATAADDGSGIYDLRCKIFFEPNSAGKWIPYPQNPPATAVAETDNATGKNDPYNESRLTTWVSGGVYYYAPFNAYYVMDKTIPDLIITGSEVNFLKAEIYNRGIGGVTADPATALLNYNNGITESVKYWYKIANGSAIWLQNKPAAAPTTLELTTMLANPAVAYSTNPATALSQIYKQNWIALFHQPFDAWTLKRRTNNGTPNVPLAPASPVLNMNRLVYPLGEIDSNFENWKTVTGGADNMTAKPWFMQ